MNLIFGFLIFLFLIHNTLAQNEHINNNILQYCQSTINLPATGQNSSIFLSFTAISKLEKSQQSCRIKIEAPDTHFLYLKINKTKRNEEFKTELNETKCPVDVFTKETPTIASYTTDPCLDEEIVPLVSDGGLFGNQIELSFMATSTKQWSLILTAVGTGEYCLNPGQFSCLQTGWTPLLCITKELLCNGIVNCPTGELLSDENPQLCNDKENNWEKIANDLLMKITGKSKAINSLLPAIQKGRDNFITEQPTTTTNLNDEYGPWGYLMLGMLICGTVLTLCGLWECCCRKAKTPRILNNESTITTASTSGIAVISAPPNYDELDQPPSYNILFPNAKVS